MCPHVASAAEHRRARGTLTTVTQQNEKQNRPKKTQQQAAYQDIPATEDSLDCDLLRISPLALFQSSGVFGGKRVRAQTG